MRIKNRPFFLHILLSSIACLFLSAVALAQSSAAPTRTQCKQWDDVYINLFNYALWATLLGSFALSLLTGFLGKFFWWCAAPRLRIFIMTLFCLALVVIGVALGPWVVGLGHYWFGGVDPKYFDCEGVAFGADGLFGGLLGTGVAAIAQWPFMILGLAFAAILGGIGALVVSRLLNRIALGAPARVKGETI